MRIIVHIDMDAFYAAVEERYNPALRRLPVAVGADPKEGKGRGVVTTANYMARKYGLHSALPISRAWRLAEAARIDEAYLDVSSLETFEAAAEHMTNLKAQIQEIEGLGCSIGIGPNKLIAKIASGYKKPQGLTLVPPEMVEEFLAPLPARVIPGIGPKSEAFLHQQDIRTIKDLSEIPAATLTDWFGKWGERLFEKARGIDDSVVSNEWTRKSVGEQETFAEDTHSPAVVTERLYDMAERIIAKLREKQFSGFRTVTLTVRFSDFQTANRSRSTKNGIAVDNDTDALWLLKQEALTLLLPFLDARENPRGKAIRLIGLRL